MTHESEHTPGPLPDRLSTRRRRRAQRDLGRAPYSELPADGAVVGEDTPASYEKGHEGKSRSIGTTRRPAREDDYIYRRMRELARQEEQEAGVGRGGLSERRYQELEAEAERLLRTEAALSYEERRLQEEWEAETPREPKRESELPVIAAVLSLPHIAWLMLRLACRTGGRGPAPRRRLVAATIIHMAFAKRRPEVWAAVKDFIGAQAFINWVYSYPNDPGVERRPDRETFYKGVHAALDPDHIDPTITEHIEVETFKQLATQFVVGPDGRPRKDRKGRPILKHPKAGVALAVDGSFTQAQVQQTIPHTDDGGRHLDILTHFRDDLRAVRYRTYGRLREFTKRVLGYKFVALVDIATARCVISTLVPADAHEPDVALYLLERLYELWPECPAEFLVGDALYAHGHGFLREVMFRFGLDPVFPWRKDYHEDTTKTTRGVPTCDCLEGRPRPMVFKQRKGKWWGHKQRIAEGLAHGHWVPEKDLGLRYEFVCPDGTCKNRTTRPWDHPGVYTFLPQTGDTRNAMLRRVLLRQRNVVESFYSWMQEHGKQGTSIERPGWANDTEVHWLLALTATFYTAKALVFENGAYDRALQEA